MSTAHKSDKFENWQLWWSFKNCNTGKTPSGAISISNSSPVAIWTFWTYLGKQSATYFPKSARFFITSSLVFFTVAKKNIQIKLTIILRKLLNMV